MDTWFAKHSHARRLLRPHAGWLILGGAAALTLWSIAAIGAIPFPDGSPDYAQKQTLWLSLSLLAMLPALWPSPKQTGRASYVLLFVSLLLLVVLILPFMPASIVPVRNHVRHWIQITPSLNIQPSELAKVAFILALAWYLRHRDSYRTLPGLLAPFLLMFVPMGLVLREPDLGSALLFPPVLFAMLVTAGAKMRHMVTLLGLSLGILLVNLLLVLYASHLPESVQMLKPYQRQRIESMLHLAVRPQPTLTVDDSAYQQAMAMTLVGSGGLAGQGVERSQRMMRFNRLPESQNDMIFAVMANRWGWLGAMGLLSLYALLIGTMLYVAWRNRDPYIRLTMVGFASLILAQTTINIGMSVAVMPIIGITLPWVSYGGSSLLSSYLIVALAFNFASRPTAILTPPSFEFTDCPD